MTPTPQLPQESRNSPLLVGVDVGTTSIKAVVFDPTGRAVAEASTSTPTYYPRPNWAYYKPDELWRCTVKTLRAVTSQVDDPGEIVSIAVTSMGESAVPMDAHGQPLYETIAWFDRRTLPQVAWLEQNIGRDRLFGVTGLSLQPIFGLCKILWLKENEPELFGRMAHWLNVGDYIAYRLSGVPAADYSLASRTLALDLQRLQWAENLLLEMGVNPDIFAPLTQSGTVLGPVTKAAAEETGLPPSVKVAVGGHDHICGALAVGVTEPGVLLNSMGTAEALLLPVEKPVMDPQIGQQGYAQSVHVVAGRYCLVGGLYTSGICVDWFREILGSDAGYATLIAAAEAIPPASLGTLFLPHLRLSNPPNDDPRGRSAFVGLSTDVKREALFRAVLEGLAYEFRHSLEPLLGYADLSELRRVACIGGGTRNNLLMQIKASVLNHPLNVVDVTEATTLGAAILGGLGAEVYRDVPAALSQLDYSQTPIEPDAADAALYESYFRRIYQKLYPTLRALHHAIYDLQNPDDDPTAL